MKENNNNSNNSGLGLLGGLFLVFLTLKLMGLIDWSWWIVTAPLWVPFGVVLAIAVVIFIASFIGSK